MSEAKKNLDELITLILVTGKLLHGDIKPSRKVAPGGCSFLQLKTLHFIQMQNNPLMKDIADFFGVTPPSATSLVEGLVKSGFLIRSAGTGDRRKVHLSITSKGIHALEAGFNAVTDRIKSVLSKLNLKDQKDLIRILKKLSV